MHIHRLACFCESGQRGACGRTLGGVVAVSRATGIARSTIDRGLADLRSGTVMFSPRVRQGGGGKPATETQPGLLETLNDLAQSSASGSCFAVGEQEPALSV